MAPRSYKPTRARKQNARSKSHRDTNRDCRSTTDTPYSTDHSNAEVIIPALKAERVDAFGALYNVQPAMSQKKKKRLDKYIGNKLKKDEMITLMKKLEAHQTKETLETDSFIKSKNLEHPNENKKHKALKVIAKERLKIADETDTNLHLMARREVECKSEDNPVAGRGSLRMLKSSAHDIGSSQGSIKVAETEISLKRSANALEIGREASYYETADVGSGLKKPLSFNGTQFVKRQKKEHESQGFGKIKYSGQSRQDDSDDVLNCDTANEKEWEDVQADQECGRSGNKFAVDKFKVSYTEYSYDKSPPCELGTSKNGLRYEQYSHSSATAVSFKAWALDQRIGTKKPLSNIDSLLESGRSQGKASASQASQPDKMPAECRIPDMKRKAYYVHVERPAETRAARERLPVYMQEQQIMEALLNNNCIVIHGETGSGKTTQVPQFLYEAGYGSPNSATPGLIGVTQPRRVAAQTMARRVGDELCDCDKVSYQIRFDGTVGPKTAIKFMTDGVLLRELSEDFMLSKYSAIVIDEAHERSMNTDILVGAVSRVLKLRESMSQDDETGRIKPLKLIIMSATLRVTDFIDNHILFPEPPPLVTTEGRQFNVTNHFSRRTKHDYVEEAYKKVCKIHRQLPPGGILVFLTGQNEINQLLGRLNATFSRGKPRVLTPKVELSMRDAALETEDIDLGDTETQHSNESNCDFSEDDEDLDIKLEGSSAANVPMGLHVLPLYSLLPNKEQLRVFEPPPGGSRLCVLASNVAETSLTIPGISYVVDSGRSKERSYDRDTGIQSFMIQWISKASAQQRSGRAGRTGHGHCYRLYSSAVYEAHFTQFSNPEIHRMPIEGLVLQMKAMNIDTVVNFPFPTPPERHELAKAEKLLGYLGAVEQRAAGNDYTITDLGKAMGLFPVPPRFSKVLVLGRQRGCLPYIIAIVAALTIGEIFLHDAELHGPHSFTTDNTSDGGTQDFHSSSQHAYNRAHAAFASLDPQCDALKLLSVVCAFEYTPTSEFCEKNFIRMKPLQETRRLRQQLTKIANSTLPAEQKLKPELKLPLPKNDQVSLIKQMLAAGFIDHLAIRADLAPNRAYSPPRRALKINSVQYIPLFTEQEAVTIHPESIISSPPEYLVYANLTKSDESGRVRMRPITPISDLALARICMGTSLISIGKPIKPWVTVGNKRTGVAKPIIGARVGRTQVGWSLLLRNVTQVFRHGEWVIDKIEAVKH